MKTLILGAALIVAALVSGGAAGLRAETDAVKLLAGADKELHDFIGQPDWQGVVSILGGTKAVLIAPDFTSGSVIIGFEEGDAVLLVRHDTQWSDPVFVRMRQASIGFQAGVKQSELLMLVLTRNAVKDMVDGVARVGGSGGFALGDLGVGGGGAGGVSGGLQMLSVSLSEGLSIGTALGGMKIAPIEALNQAAYGSGFDMSAVLAKPGGSYAPAAKLRETLAETVRKSRSD